MEHLTVGEAAEALQVSVPTVKRYIYEGDLRSAKLPGGQHRIPASEIERLLSPDAPTAADPGLDQRLHVVEHWLTDLESEIERLSAALSVLSHYCAHHPQQEEPPLMPTTPQASAQVQVLGPGCKKCETLYKLTLAALQEMGREDVAVDHVRDMDDIAAFGPVLTPALVVDGNVVLTGKVPTEAALRELLQERLS